MPAKIKHPEIHFWNCVYKDESEKCWPWMLCTNGRYGTFYPLEQTTGEVIAHRIAFLLKRGPIPDGLEVCHSCDNPICCNPDHLFLATHKENMADMMRKGRWNGGIGANQGCAKLNPGKVREIRAKIKAGWSMNQLALRFRVTKGCILRVKNRKNWKHVV